MQLNADFTQPASARPEDTDWIASPMPGVDRCMLDRLGHDGARATSIVRYAPGSAFSTHIHHGGEEFLVLEGVFQDEHGDYPPGTYVRNPPTSRHTPGAAEGCVIFVKLGQFSLSDRTFARISTDKIGALPDPQRQGVTVTPLYKDSRETVQMEFCESGTGFELVAAGGVEVLVVEGDLTCETAGDDCHGHYGRHGWIRLPAGQTAQLTAGELGAKLWVKRGHLTATVLQDSAFTHLEATRKADR